MVYAVVYYQGMFINCRWSSRSVGRTLCYFKTSRPSSPSNIQRFAQTHNSPIFLFVCDFFYFVYLGWDTRISLIYISLSLFQYELLFCVQELDDSITYSYVQVSESNFVLWLLLVSNSRYWLQQVLFTSITIIRKCTWKKWQN